MVDTTTLRTCFQTSGILQDNLPMARGKYQPVQVYLVTVHSPVMPGWCKAVACGKRMLRLTCSDDARSSGVSSEIAYGCPSRRGSLCATELMNQTSHPAMVGRSAEAHDAVDDLRNSSGAVASWLDRLPRDRLVHSPSPGLGPGRPCHPIDHRAQTSRLNETLVLPCD